tara:strand:- start:206 stop:400 length:195 start_codon:yes stop_codon:yes gene_type:complete
MAKSKEINNQKIQAEINQLRKSLLNFRFQKATGQLEKTAELKKIRKKIARLKTDFNKKIGEINA